MDMRELDRQALRAIPRLFEVGAVVKYLDEGQYIYGTIERLGGSNDAKVAIVQWDDGKNTQIYVDRLEEA